MSDYISLVEAKARITVATGLHDVDELLESELDRLGLRAEHPVATEEPVRGEINLFASGITWVDREYDERTRPSPAGNAGIIDSAVIENLIARLQKKSLPPALYNGSYITPHIALMLEAIELFDIPERTPKKDELKQHFLGKFLPDGSPITDNQASAMATFCRPPEAMKGGNKRV
jgi:hypothetical protein